ncbi:MAG: putative phosphatase [Gemmatimonadetes bacterium]|nr:putative phosphatase [Gemmatimonadota bacterium]
MLHLTRRLTLAALATLPLSTLAAQSKAIAATATAPAPPKLVVFITIDQMRADYLERFAKDFTAGLARLSNGGAVFTNAFQDHANSETAPGHATTMSGREPWKTGIVLNDIGVPDPSAPLIGPRTGQQGASPYRFRGSTLIDWMRLKDQRSHALSVSRKDRGAILPLGRAHEGVYWYALDGRFTTSRYYADTLPSWLTRFNERKLPQSYAGKAWEPVLPLSRYPEPDSIAIEDMQHATRELAFPHRISANPDSAARDFANFPWMDEVNVALALEGVQAMGLGKGPQADLLAISLSTTDAVGHRFGPQSREVHDNMVRLDRTLGVLIDSLYKLRDSSTIIFALTADHAIAMPPEMLPVQKGQLPHERADLSALAASFRKTLALDTAALSFVDGILFLEPRALQARGIDRDSVARAFAKQAIGQPGVLRADLFSAILRADTLHDAVARRWRHAIPPDVPVAVVVSLRKGSMWVRTRTASHLSPYDEDTHVPLLFYGPGITTGKFAEFARVVDMAPTLAWLVDVTPTEALDGHVLRKALKKR